MSALHDRLERERLDRSRRGRTRSMAVGEGVSFTSNDYLGLGRHPAVAGAIGDALARGVAHGASGSRLLSGHHDAHRVAEEDFARFVGRQSALLFGSGYVANLGLLTSLPVRRDLVVLDAHAHASIKEGARASLATRRTFAHNDPADLARALRDRETFECAFVVVEGIYSMDGDAAPLAELDRVAAAHDAHIIVDEAHATGLFGARLRGIHEHCAIERLPLATVHPCGKAIGCSGAFVAADALVVDAIINTARPFIFSTAPSPLVAVAISKALELLPTMRSEVVRLHSLARRFRDAIAPLRHWSVLDSCGPIVAIAIGADRDALAAAERLRHNGFDVRAVRPPTVPEGTARLRITLTSERSIEEVDRLAEALIATETWLCGGGDA